ncbi:PatB family C-S lyase [Cochlodiniinecator piscidefendens]|uniref:PatB family C-S lyase n=1 Tax=Cochlodiniinecator piscidefendens TaxID=2715756 RepID=UPI00197C5FE7|nr:PatB family C-S lyase [Cochlodiniinecator piscidefendens]
MIIIYHNPECGTSRNVVDTVRKSGDSFDVVEYLTEGWTRHQLNTLFAAANLTPRMALRKTKSPALEMGLLEDGVNDETILNTMLEHPVLVNRPIVVSPKGVRLCRPSETVLELLNQWPSGPLYKEDGEMVLDDKGKPAKLDSFDFDKEIDRRAVPALKVHPMVLGHDGTELFPAGVADMDFPAPPAVTEALANRVAHGIFGYEAVPDGLISTLVAWQKNRHGWTVDPDHILRAPNVLNSLSMALNLFTDVGDGIIVQPPVFFDFADIIAENGRRMVRNPLILREGRYEMDFDGLEIIAADPSVKMMFLCNPHNPVGRVWAKSTLAQIGEICRAHNVLVVSDEIHGDITFTGHRYTPFASISEADALNCISCLSPAKAFNIAACCSSFTVIADPKRRDAFKAENSRLTVNKNNAFASAAMEAAYDRGAPWLDAATDYIEGNLALVRVRLDTVPEVTLIEPEGTFLLWLDFRELGFAPKDLTQFLRRKAGWAITRGAAFDEGGAGFGRLNIACTRARLDAALNALINAISEHRKIRT